jgi:hypothetical protein
VPGPQRPSTSATHAHVAEALGLLGWLALVAVVLDQVAARL